jgi:putative hydrolase
LAVDFHTHTVASGHAFSTLHDNLREAAGKGIAGIAITDHGPAFKGSTSASYFQLMAKRMPQRIEGVRVFTGIELNVLDAEGNTDMPEISSGRLEVVLAGFHPPTSYHDLGREGNTRALIAAMDRHPAIGILAHPVNHWFEIDPVAVAKAAARNGVAVEINNSAFARPEMPLEAMDLLARTTLEEGGTFALSSDAHIWTEVGDDRHVAQFLQRNAIPADRIGNRNLAAAQRSVRERAEAAQRRPVP